MKLTPSISYLTGFVIGDCASQVRSGYIQIVSSSTHPGFLRGFSQSAKRCHPSSLGIYPGRRIKHNGRVDYRWFCWAIFPKSYENFFRSDHDAIISRVSVDDDLFYSFVAGFSDAEGNWQPSRRYGNRVHYSFRFFSTDYRLPIGLAEQLGVRGFTCTLRLKERAGSRVRVIMLRHDYWVLRLSKRSDVMKLARTILSYSQHSEKRRKMAFMIRNECNNDWTAFHREWRALGLAISRESDETRELARVEFERRHSDGATKIRQA